MMSDEKTRFWRDSAKILYWSCPDCGAQLTQYRSEYWEARAICVECGTAYKADWAKVEEEGTSPLTDA